MRSHIVVKGWIELEGKRLSDGEVKTILSENPGVTSRFGGEFFLKWNGCMARDHFGIMAGNCPAGTVVCNGKDTLRVEPEYPPMDLGETIEIAVRLRSDEGIVALSGGVDSALVAQLAERECIAVGVAGSHDLRRAQQVATELGLPLNTLVVDPGSIEAALVQVLRVIPKIDPVNASVAATLYFVAEWAGSHGYRRILAGQGADELFGGYARYLQTDTLGQDLERDFQCLPIQLARDLAVAALHNTSFSLPYMDVRVVQAARAIPPEKKVCGGVRKRPLRDAAERYLPHSIAQYEKKAMQYGSGVMREIQRLASQKGHKKSVQDYLAQIAKAERLNYSVET
jgi:asparagine synthase (glutamine-hydrolysing)